MSKNSDYERKSMDERLFLKKILPLFYKGEVCDVSFQFTPVDGQDVYDVAVCLFDPLTKSVVHRHIIEIKVRDKYYDDLMLEQKKLNALKEVSKMADGIIYYISVTPRGTFIFNLTELENEFVFHKQELPVSTVDPSRGTIRKTVTNVPVSKGKRLNVFTSDLEMLRLEEAKTSNIKNMVEQHSKTREIYKGIRGFEI